MALDGAGIKELNQQVSMARKMPLNFGLALGKKAEDTALVMHRKKEGSILFKQARKADGVEMAKSTFGTVTIDGNNMTFACESEPPAGMKKKCKAFLKSAKLSLKISILSPDGTEFEKGDDEDEDLVQGEGLDQGENLDQGEDPDTNEEPETQPDPGKRKAAKVALVARIKAANAELLQLSQKDKDRLAPALKTVLGMVSDDALEKALAGLGKIEAAIAAAGGSGGGKKPGGDPDPDDGPTGPGNDDAERERWLKGAARLKPLVAAAVKLPGGDPGALRAAWAWANEKANALVPDYRAAAGSLPEITRLVQLANQKAPPAPEVAQSDNADVQALLARHKSISDVAATLDGPVADRLTAALDRAKAQIDARKLNAASASLDKLEAAITRLGAEVPKPNAQKTEADTADINDTLKQMAPDIRAALAQNSDLRAQLAGLVETARSPASDPGKAQAALAALTELLGRRDEKADAEGGLSLVRLGKTRIEWIGVRDTSLAAIDELSAKINDFYEGFPALLPQIGASIAKLNTLVARIDNNLHNQLDVVLNARDEESRAREIQTAKSLIRGLSSFIDSDPVARTIDDNPFDPGLRVVAPVRSTLSEISAALG